MKDVPTTLIENREKSARQRGYLVEKDLLLLIMEMLILVEYWNSHVKHVVGVGIDPVFRHKRDPRRESDASASPQKSAAKGGHLLEDRGNLSSNMWLEQDRPLQAQDGVVDIHQHQSAHDVNHVLLLTTLVKARVSAGSGTRLGRARTSNQRHDVNIVQEHDLEARREHQRALENIPNLVHNSARMYNPHPVQVLYRPEG